MRGASECRLRSEVVQSHQQIISNGYSSINTIRSFFFCETAACKKDKKATATSAAVAMNYLEGEASALKPSNAPKSQRPILKKFIDDVTTLAKVYSVYSTETTSTEIATNTGVLYYVSANVGSDIYLLTSAVAASKVIFADWGVGAVAVLYTMQVDNQVLTSKKSNAATDIGAINDLEQDAVALRKDANGPSEHFNALLVTFANAQVEVCKAKETYLRRRSRRSRTRNSRQTFRRSPFSSPRSWTCRRHFPSNQVKGTVPNVANQALLVMDMQNGIVERYADKVEPLLGTLGAALVAARAKAMTVIFVRVAFREGAPEASAKNKSFAALAGSPAMDETSYATQIHERLAPWRVNYWSPSGE